MLNIVQRQFVFQKIPTIFNGESGPVTIPKYRMESTLPDIPAMPYIAIGFPSEGMDLGFWRTAGPTRIYYDHINGSYAFEYGKWLKATVSIYMVHDQPTEIEDYMAQLYLWLLSQQWTFGYHPHGTARPRIKFGELLTATPISYKFLNKKVRPERNAYVSMFDFSIWYMLHWVVVGPPILAADLTVKIPEFTTYSDWKKNLHCLRLTSYMAGSYGIDMRVV
jgi:hypothetical protein